MTRLLRRLTVLLPAVLTLSVATSAPAGRRSPAGALTPPVATTASPSSTPTPPGGCDGCIVALDAICWESPTSTICPVPVRYSGPAPAQLTIHFRTEPGTAHPPVDYVNVEDGTVFIPSGATTGTADIQLPPNAGGGQVRTFSVVFFAPSYGRLVRDRAQVTLSPRA